LQYADKLFQIANSHSYVLPAKGNVKILVFGICGRIRNLDLVPNHWRGIEKKGRGSGQRVHYSSILFETVKRPTVAGYRLCAEDMQEGERIKKAKKGARVSSGGIASN